MARVLLPNFVFLWIPRSVEKDIGKEEKKSFETYQSAMKLFNENRCRHSFTKIESFDAFMDILNGSDEEGEDQRYRNIFILIGHGSINQGWMTFSKSGGGILTPRRIVNHWRPKKPCDFIATQCFSSYFLNFINNPCLLQLQNVRWIPLGDMTTPLTYNVDLIYASFHVELMNLLESYLSSYPELISLDEPNCSLMRAFTSVVNSTIMENTHVVPTGGNPLINTNNIFIFMIILSFMIGVPTIIILLVSMYYVLPEKYRGYFCIVCGSIILFMIIICCLVLLL